MKIYLEYIFIINFLLDFMILYGTKRILKRNTSNYKLIISSVIGSFSTFILLINVSNIELFIIKIILSIIMNITAFGSNNLKENILYFYLISIIIGGLIYLFDLKTNPYLNMFLITILTPVIILIIIKEQTNLKTTIKDKYLVNITIKNKEYNLEGFIDTGNRLKSPLSNKSVILVNLNIPIDNALYVPYKALNTTGIIPCLKPEKVLIDGKNISNCLIGISKDKFSLNGENCILPNILKEIL